MPISICTDSLREAAGSLRAGDRILLSGKYVFCHSDAELAQNLGCAPSSIRMKITRAKRKAMAVFQPEVLIHDYS